jgi:hypothetical protein
MRKPRETPQETIARTSALLNRITGKTPTASAQELTADVAQKLKAFTNLLCIKCKKPSEARICDDCRNKSKVEKKDKTFENGKGYKYCYDDDGKVVLKSRHLMEKKLGRKLEDHLAVTYRDGNRQNLSEDNLVVVFKTGTPLSSLTCRCCGARGNWEVNDVE